MQKDKNEKLEKHLHDAHKAIESAIAEAQSNTEEEKHAVKTFESIRKEELNGMGDNWELIRIIVD